MTTMGPLSLARLCQDLVKDQPEVVISYQEADPEALNLTIDA